MTSDNLEALLTKHAQQATHDILHCAPDVKDQLAAWVDSAHVQAPVRQAVPWMTGPLSALLAVDVVVHDDWPAGRWELTSDGKTTAWYWPNHDRSYPPVSEGKSPLVSEATSTSGKKETCPRCWGATVDPQTGRTCTRCDGKGWVYA